jgi:hypothetical protein
LPTGGQTKYQNIGWSMIAVGWVLPFYGEVFLSRAVSSTKGGRLRRYFLFEGKATETGNAIYIHGPSNESIFSPAVYA